MTTSSSSFLKSAAKCLIYSFGAMTAFIGLCLYGKMIAVGFIDTLLYLFPAWWKAVHIEDYEAYAYAFVIALASAIFCMSNKLEDERKALGSKYKNYLIVLTIVFTISYAHVVMMFPQKWVEVLNLLNGSGVLYGIMTIVYLFVGFIAYAWISHLFFLDDDDTKTLSQKEITTPNVPPVTQEVQTVRLEETWEQRFARQAAERRKNKNS